MTRLSGVVLIGVLLLGGCSTTAPQEAPEPTPAAVESTTTFSDITTLEEGIAHVRSLSASTPDLADEMIGSADVIGDLVVDADLPWDVNNAIGQDLLSLDIDIRNDPAGAKALLSEFNRIVDEIEGAI